MTIHLNFYKFTTSTIVIFILQSERFTDHSWSTKAQNLCMKDVFKAHEKMAKAAMTQTSEDKA